MEHRFSSHGEITVEHMHNVVGQVLFTVGCEFPNVAEEDREFDLLPLTGGTALEFVEIENDNVLCVVEESADDHIAVDTSLARQSGEIVPASLGWHLLPDRIRRRNIG
ncbi:hypothetical protein [Methyloglobulus sp.]|uniref:hypothetical protein n=1 Tax=Methyloglobulus sp. TaxID=2518622 RepID=UPI003989407C